MSQHENHRHRGIRADVPRSAMLSNEAWHAIARALDLSKRQIQVIRGIFDDEIESSIASRLGISSHTVHTHIERIHHKLGVHDRVELVLLVIAEFLRLTACPGSALPPICGRNGAGNCPLQNATPGN